MLGYYAAAESAATPHALLQAGRRKGSTGIYIRYAVTYQRYDIHNTQQPGRLREWYCRAAAGRLPSRIAAAAVGRRDRYTTRRREEG